MDLHGKALYLTYDGLTDPLGQAQILPYLLGLETQGMGFVIISFETHDYSLPELSSYVGSHVHSPGSKGDF